MPQPPIIAAAGPALPRRLHSVIAAPFLAVLMLVGCKTEDPAPPPTPRPVTVAVATPQPDAQHVTLTGAVAAQVEAKLSFRTGGQITALAADVGDRVSQGQVLARLDPKVQQADVDSAQAAVASAQADVRQAQAAFDRTQGLFDRGYSTRKDFDAAQQALKVAEASVTSTEAQLASAREALSFTDLTSPSDGVVTDRDLDAGEVAAAAATVMTIAPDGPRDAVFDLPESLLLGTHEPDRIEVALASDPAVQTHGSIRQIAPSVDRSSGTVRVKVGLVETPAQMSLGAAVIGSAVLTAGDVVSVPVAAVTTIDGQPAVWVVDPANGAATPRRVEFSAFQATTATVESGLAAGDRVIVGGTTLLRPGEVVAGTEQAAP